LGFRSTPRVTTIERQQLPTFCSGREATLAPITARTSLVSAAKLILEAAANPEIMDSVSVTVIGFPADLFVAELREKPWKCR
jgi:hypothetical protein